MHNIRDLRKNLDNFKKRLHERNFEFKTDIFENLDKTNRKLIAQKEKLEEEKVFYLNQKISLTLKNQKKFQKKYQKYPRSKILHKKNLMNYCIFYQILQKMMCRLVKMKIQIS